MPDLADTAATINDPPKEDLRSLSYFTAKAMRAMTGSSEMQELRQLTETIARPTEPRRSRGQSRDSTKPAKMSQAPAEPETEEPLCLGHIYL